MTIRYSKTATRAMWAIDTACGHKTRSCGWCFAYVPARKDGTHRIICLHCGKKQLLGLPAPTTWPTPPVTWNDPQT